ncbi:Aldose epim domain containing protein [Asbolus verrucosus]|uniref:Aldose 1-epimerase n=1 Tax=Asbolus verrucosus TaxID=1661398 RepID=A0A482VLD5_ASBVE|nr:Aldose epim domain containing protein [Asbolus verrucosus]
MVNLREDEFGVYTDETAGKSIPVKRFTWENENKLSVQVITYGATIISIKFPDKDGIIEDVVTGFSNLTGYRNAENPYFGATIGRVANRIAFGKFDCLGTVVEVSKNAEPHQLHGGFVGFDKVIWEHFVDSNKLILSYHSADLEEGFPGSVVTHARFELTSKNEFVIEFKATSTKPTYINLTSHSYFNLAGHSKGAAELYKHMVCINADRITEVGDDGIPTGQLLPVAGTVFDFQQLKILGDAIGRLPDRDGFDHNFCIKVGAGKRDHIARVYHPGSERTLDVYSNQPGVQFYTANNFPEDPGADKDDKSEVKTLAGKDGNYYKHGAFCLETQNWPDAANHKNFPKAITRPGETYYHYVAYKFFVKDCKCSEFSF